jgi:signal transduction histidine kinase
MMKLLHYTGRYFLIFSLLSFIIGGVVLFFTLNYMLDHEMDESLRHTRSVLHKELSKRDSLPSVVEVMDEVIDIHEILTLTKEQIFKDTFRMVEETEEDGTTELELEPFRQYIYTEQIKGKNYRIALNHSKFENEHLLTAIIGLIIGLLLLFLVVINLFNRYLSVKLWQPFYQIVESVKQFNMAKTPPHQGINTHIEEFKTLDEALQKMTAKISRDYHSLKQFTENASHEMQTPLAIIQSQIELLSQNETQEEKTVRQLHQIQLAARKLSKLNQALLLLTRIENRQFNQTEKVNLAEVIQQKIDSLELLIAAKSIEVSTHLQPVFVMANLLLMDILISNLLSNAIKHNLFSGKIKIVLTNKKLSVGNDGALSFIPTKELFERFKKADDAAKSVGLGLSIVKEICEVNNWSINYHHQAGWHDVEIDFF